MPDEETVIEEPTKENTTAPSHQETPNTENDPPAQKHNPQTHDSENIIIIKKIKKVGGHHGGAWKIAYADFVTAMMTFFLLMWLLSMLNKYQLQGISEYFQKPLKEAFNQTDPKKDKIAVKNGVETTNKLLAPPKQDPVQKNIKKDENENTPEKMKEVFQKELEKNLELSQYKNALNFKVISEGLKIELKDLENRPMFSRGMTDFADYAQKILGWLSTLLNQYPNRVMIVGHTDNIPFMKETRYGNWELSADRATATRRVLIESGMDEAKVVRVAGVADTDALDQTVASDASNRRIVIIVLTDTAYKAMQEE